MLASGISLKKQNFHRSSYSPFRNIIQNDDDVDGGGGGSSGGKNKSSTVQEQQQRSLLIDQFALDSESLLKDSQCHSVLNAGEDDELFITGYKRCIWRTIICWFFITLTCGLLRLILHWLNHWYLIATHTTCPINKAEKILIREVYQGNHELFYVKNVIILNFKNLTQMKIDEHKYSHLFPMDSSIDHSQFYLSVHFSSGNFYHTDEIRLFCCKQLRYIWNPQTRIYQKLQGLDNNVQSQYLHHHKGLTQAEQNSRRIIYGLNKITIPVKSILTLFCVEILNPFYVFQIFSVCLWISYNYYYYAALIVVMFGVSITMQIRQTRKNQNALQNTLKKCDSATIIMENGETINASTDSLVPGDLIEIPSSGCLMHCDAILLSGNCILDESILTGESVPVTKTPLPLKRDLMFDKKEHSRHTLFCGTKVLQTRYIAGEKVLAIVINTGNITAKGGLIRSILYPPPVDYKFEKDSYKFIALLGLVASVGFVYTVVSKVLRSISGLKIAIESLDLITIAVPPALPAAMTVGRIYAQKRLQNRNIYCISPRSINVAGSIDCVCFDKTGTLTEDGLDMWGVVPRSSTNQFQIPLKQIDRLPCDHFLYGMVTCHSITIMQGVMKGDPLDLKMFESTGWILEDVNVADDNKYDLLFPTIVRRQPKKQHQDINSKTMQNKESTSTESDEDLYEHQIGIVKEFPFTSSLQRMSVITRLLTDDHYNVYCKGSPEMIQTLCRPATIPDNYLRQLEIYAQQGYRIIAIAYKELDKKITYSRAQRLSRIKIENDLEFQGFVILENRLKPDTTEVIKSLTKANIRTVMVTGDNILTALSVAKDCSMIKKKQSVIMVNTRLQCNGKYELYYNLIGTTSPLVAISQHQQQDDTTITTTDRSYVNNNGDIYSIMTNSNSLASLETIDTWTTHRDIVDSNVTTTTTIATGNNDTKLHNNNNNNINNNNNNNSNSKKFIKFPIINKKKFHHNHNCYDIDGDDGGGRNTDKKYFNNNYRFAMVGKTWSIIREQYPFLLNKFVARGTIFARMSPDQKQSLILELQDLGYYVAMCGDGANDCGALKAAHTGISLSEAESSVASPFTSKQPTISCVPNVIKEGRAALVTSFGLFKYMVAYSLVQFVSVFMLYSIDSNLTDIQFLYIDLGLITIFAFYFGKTEAYDGPLVKYPPLNSLITFSPVISLALHLITAIIFQIIGWYHVKSEIWFKPFNISAIQNDDDLGCYENYTIFIISCFQYIILAFIFSKGAPYRKTILSNLPFLFTLIINLCLVIYLAILPAQFLVDKFQLVIPPDMKFRLYLLLYGCFNFIISLFIELFIIEYLVFNKVSETIRQYNTIETELNLNLKWPPLSSINDNNDNGRSSDINNDNDDNKSSPISYAEIRAEHTIDMRAPDNSVLNNFFDSTKPNQSDEDDDDDDNDDNNGKMILETNLYQHHVNKDSSMQSSIDELSHYESALSLHDEKSSNTTLWNSTKNLNDETFLTTGSVELQSILTPTIGTVIAKTATATTTIDSNATTVATNVADTVNNCKINIKKDQMNDKLS